MSERRDDPDPDSPTTALLMRTWDDGEAALVRHLLEAYGIPCQVVSDVPHSVLPLNVDGLGEVRLLVPASDLENARTLLAEHRRQGLEMVKGGRRPGARVGEEAPEEEDSEDLEREEGA